MLNYGSSTLHLKLSKKKKKDKKKKNKILCHILFEWLFVFFYFILFLPCMFPLELYKLNEILQECVGRCK